MQALGVFDFCPPWGLECTWLMLNVGTFERPHSGGEQAKVNVDNLNALGQ